MSSNKDYTEEKLMEKNQLINNKREEKLMEKNQLINNKRDLAAVVAEMNLFLCEVTYVIPVAVKPPIEPTKFVVELMTKEEPRSLGLHEPFSVYVTKVKEQTYIPREWKNVPLFNSEGLDNITHEMFKPDPKRENAKEQIEKILSELNDEQKSYIKNELESKKVF